MRDCNHGAALHEPAERFADRFLGIAIERSGGFIKQDNGRSLQKGSRNRDTLALAARKFNATIAATMSNPPGRSRMNSQRAAAAA